MRVMFLALILWAGVEITTQALGGGGISVNAQVALVAVCAMFFGADGYIKGKRAEAGKVED